MINDNWNPGHSVNKGYPYNGIESLKRWPEFNRPHIGLDENETAYIAIDKEVFPEAPSFPERLDDVSTFLLHRLFDYKVALEMAEDQLKTVFEERPFIPERLGFKTIHNNKSPFDGPPSRLYQSELSENFSLFRKPQDVNDPNFDNSGWVINIRQEDGTFKEIEASLPCERIAYAFFFAIGMKMPERGLNQSENG